MMSRIKPSTLAHLLLLGVVCVWGTTFVLVKDALRDASPLLFNMIRMTLAAIALLMINYRQLKTITRDGLLSGILVGVLLATGYQFQTMGLARTTAAKSAFITGLVVVFVPLLTSIPAIRPHTSHAPRWTSFFGAALAFAGLLLLTTPSGTTLANLFTSISTGDLLTLICALSFAGHLLALAYTSPRVPLRQLSTSQIAIAAFFMIVTLPLGGRIYFHLTVRLVIALAVTSLIATAAAFTIQSWAQQHLAPTHIALLLTLEPVFAGIVSFLFLGERFGLRSIAGALLILAGILVTELLSSAEPVPTYPSG